MNINTWRNSGEYKNLIDNALTNIIKGAHLSCSESETALVFEREIYYLIRSELGIELHIQKETPVSGIHHTFEGLSNRKSGQGRLDAVVNNLIIEYKHHLKLQSDKQKESAISQVEDYLTALEKKSGSKFDAILTDGISICYFSYVGDTIRHTSLRLLRVEDVDRIIGAILNNQAKKFEPRNIVADFAISDKYSSDSRDIARILFEMLRDKCTEKSQMLFTEWQVLMRLSVEDNGKSGDIEKRRNDLSAIFNISVDNPEIEYTALFALQTTYAIIVKLIACKVLDLLNFNEETQGYADLASLPSNKMQEFFSRMEDGYSYRNMGVRNFLEGDYFSWYADSSQWSDKFWSSIQNVMRKIDEYSTFSLDVQYAPIDVFKDLYMSIIPQSIRHSTGEYFTPEWLADCVINEAMSLHSKDEWKAIDPCCGSGIFIISLIKHIVGQNTCISDLTTEQRNNLLHQILNRVHGIDINPLSVLSARVSYFLAIHQLGDVRNIEIPVYLGDSAIVPISLQIGDIPCYKYTIDTVKNGFDVFLPQRFVKTKEFGDIMSRLQALVKTDDAEVLFKVFLSYLSADELNCSELVDKIKNLSEKLVYLHKNNWDGIWIRIVTNFMLIARLQEFDYIVGNPPWVKWEHLPAAYTRKIREFCDIRHIFCNDGMFGGAQLNICALISNVAATNWLSKDGVLAFLMPDSIMSQNSYEEYRNFYIDFESKKRLYLQRIDRWMAPLRPFRVGKKCVTQDFNTYFFASNSVDYLDGVPVREISRVINITDEVLNMCPDYHSALNYLTISYKKAKQLSLVSTAFTYSSDEFDFSKITTNADSSYYYRTGVESTPFEIFKLLGVGKSDKENHYRFRNKTLKTSKYKVEDIPFDGWDFPTHYIYPMVEGPAISAFNYDVANNFHIVPYNETNPRVPVPLADMALSDSALVEYFANHRSILEMQSNKSKTMHCGKEFYALSKIGYYTFAPYIVAARDNSSFCSCVVHPTMTPWGELKQSICVKHTIIISQGKDGHLITEEEAHYINGILNSSIVKSYIHNTFKTNGFSLNKSHLFLPYFDSKNAIMQQIAEVSMKATNHSITVEEAMSSLTTLYLQLCDELNH